MKKFIVGTLIVLMLSTSSASACTGVYVGNKQSSDGSTFIARTEDGFMNLNNKRFLVHPRVKNEEGSYFENVYGFKMLLPRISYRYTSLSDSNLTGEGENPYGEAGINEFGVMVSATVSTKANEKAYAADPLVENGIAEISMEEVLLIQSKTAKEALDLLTDIIDRQGTAESNALFIADQNETWYIETYTGHQYFAKKLSGNEVGVIPNTYSLGCVNLEDEDVVYSKDLVKLAKDNNFLVEENGTINLLKTYGVIATDNSKYRIFGGYNFLAPSIKMTPDRNYYNNFFKADYKISLLDLKKLYSYRNEGTKFSKDINSNIRVIGSNAQTETHIFQVNDDYEEVVGNLEWVCYASSQYGVFIPHFAALMTDSIDEVTNNNMEYDENSAYWVFNKLRALCTEDRELYGTGVEEYWYNYQKELEVRQKEINKQMNELYKIDPVAASNKANQLAEALTKESISRAKQIISELEMNMFLNKGNCVGITKPFIPSLTQDNKYTSYSFNMGKDITFNELQTYTVKAGDCLSVIASKFKTTVSKIKEDNNLNSDLIITGSKLVIN